MSGTALGTKDTALTIGQNILSRLAAFPIIILVAMVIITLQKHQLEFQGRPILSPEAAGPNLEERLQSFSSHLHLSGLRFSKMKWMGESSVSTRQQEGRAGGWCLNEPSVLCAAVMMIIVNCSYHY